MTSDDVLAEFRSAGALLEGHFVLSSGLHSAVFLQKMAIFTDPVRTARVCSALAERITARYGKVDYVVKPNGGNNAGHTVVVGGEKYELKLLPAGVLSENATPIIGNGCVVNLEALFEEMRQVRKEREQEGCCWGVGLPV